MPAVAASATTKRRGGRKELVLIEGGPVRVAGWALVACVVVVAGCAPMRRFVDRHGPGAPPPLDEEAFAAKPMKPYRITTPRAGVPGDALIGRTRTYRVREGETLFD